MSENIIEKIVYDILQDRLLYGNSTKWANWMSQLTLFTCQYCAEQHGRIVDISILDNKSEVEAHPRCKCVYVPMRTKRAGTATNKGFAGADAQLFYGYGLPDYYVDKETAKQAGWKNRKGNLNEVLPGIMIGGDIYKNKNGKLPNAPGRVWYECDINYKKGFRNDERVLYSNDGLIFVTYDHYHTFYETTR